VARDLLTESKAVKGELPGIIIGRELARKLDLKLGDSVRLVSPLSALDAGGWSSAGEMPRSADYRISGIFFAGFNEYDTRLVYMHMNEAQSFYRQGDVAYGVEIKVDDVYQARTIAKQLEARLEKTSKLEPSPYRLIDWSELNNNLFTALRTQKLWLQILIGFIVVLAAFNVLAALMMLVIRKTREISILKSMGTSSFGVARVFLGAGLNIWLVGTALGLAWGYLGGVILRRYGFPLDRNVYLISELPVEMSVLQFVLTALFALVICLLFTAYPSWRASRLDPVEGLRYE
jgi:lipoprotein-releasing system permease protein